MSFSVSVLGWPSTSASRMQLNVSCSGVCLYSWFSTTVWSSPRFSSTTSRVPERSDSSRRSAIPLIRPSFTSSAIRSLIALLFTWYGNSVTTMFVLPPLVCSV